MPLGCFVLAAAAMMMWFGGQGLYETWNLNEQRSVSLEEVVREKPGIGWFKITDGRWRLSDAGVIQGIAGGSNGSIYAPVRRVGEQPQSEAKIDVLLHISNDAEARKLNSLVSKPAEAQATILNEDTSFTVEHPVEGMVEFGARSDSDDMKAIRNAFSGQLNPDFIVITDHGRPPGYLGSLAIFLGGLALLVVSMLVMGRKGAGEVTDD